MIKELNKELLSESEEIFYILSKYLDKETSEKLVKDILKYTLKKQINKIQEIINISDEVINNRKISNDLFTNGILSAHNGRKETYNTLIKEINNKIELLKLI